MDHIYATVGALTMSLPWFRNAPGAGRNADLTNGPRTRLHPKECNRLEGIYMENTNSVVKHGLE